MTHGWYVLLALLCVVVPLVAGAFLKRGNVEPPSVPDIDEDEMKARIDAVLDEWAS